MLSHTQRIEAARSAVDFICGGNGDALDRPVPNCPGWTIYNAMVHVGRVGIAWRSMILASPDDPDSRARGYADAEARGPGHSPTDLASWAHSALDELEGDTERPSYFSMTGGHGTRSLWAWHASSELAVHVLDVQDALGLEPHLDDALAADAVVYACTYFLPAMRNATGRDPGAVRIEFVHEDGRIVDVVSVESSGDGSTVLRGDPTQLLLALWGRPFHDVVVEGDEAVFDAWRQLPTEAFQFGAWD